MRCFDMSEKKYLEKRDFIKTDEPEAGDQLKEGSEPIFVIHKHDASNLHYDFRLEIDGTLKSWAVPKGPSLDPSVKRLAIPTDDHPLNYAYFEGTIPEEEYGGGTVMIWDRGPIRPVKEVDQARQHFKKAYQDGHLEVELQGEKLQGGFAFIRSDSGKMAGKWLIVKMDDDAADARRKPKSTQAESAVSGRSLEEIEAEQEKQAGHD